MPGRASAAEHPVWCRAGRGEGAEVRVRRTSTSSSASRYRSSPSGVAQQAEQPSCKRTTEAALTWPFVSSGARFGMYWAQSPASFLTARGIAYRPTIGSDISARVLLEAKGRTPRACPKSAVPAATRSGGAADLSRWVAAPNADSGRPAGPPRVQATVCRSSGYECAGVSAGSPTRHRQAGLFAL